MDVALVSPSGAAIIGLRVVLDATRRTKLQLCSLTGQVKLGCSHQDDLVIDWESECHHYDRSGSYLYVDEDERFWSERDVVEATLRRTQERWNLHAQDLANRAA